VACRSQGSLQSLNRRMWSAAFTGPCHASFLARLVDSALTDSRN
jgi:hypothetical protein